MAPDTLFSTALIPEADRFQRAELAAHLGQLSEPQRASPFFVAPNSRSVAPDFERSAQVEALKAKGL